MQGGVAVQGDYSASSIITHCPGKESLGSRDVPSFAQKKVNGAVRFIHGAVEVDPAAFDFEVSLVHAPGPAHRPRVMVPAFFKVRHVTLYPPQDRRVGQHDSAFGHHLNQITRAQLEGQIPSHAQDNDFIVKMTALKKFPYRAGFFHYRRLQPTTQFFKFAPEPELRRHDCASHCAHWIEVTRNRRTYETDFHKEFFATTSRYFSLFVGGLPAMCTAPVVGGHESGLRAGVERPIGKGNGRG